jgi:hypothetical protein
LLWARIAHNLLRDVLNELPINGGVELSPLRLGWPTVIGWGLRQSQKWRGRMTASKGRHTHLQPNLKMRVGVTSVRSLMRFADARPANARNLSNILRWLTRQMGKPSVHVAMFILLCDPPHHQHHGFVGLKALPIDPSEKESEIHIRCIESSISDDPSAFSPLFDKL